MPAASSLIPRQIPEMPAPMIAAATGVAGAALAALCGDIGVSVTRPRRQGQCATRLVRHVVANAAYVDRPRARPPLRVRAAPSSGEGAAARLRGPRDAPPSGHDSLPAGAAVLRPG